MAIRRRKARGRLYVFVAMIALTIIAVVLLIRFSTGGTVETDSLSFEKVVSTVIVRDEQVATAETYGKIIFLAAEGERVTSGTKVAEVFKWGYNENILQDLLTLQQEIRTYQVDTILKDIMDTELQALDKSIQEKVDAITASIRGENDQDPLLLERELKRLMTDRRELLLTKVQPDEKLTDLYEREQTLMDRMEVWKGDALAVSSGLISFYFDGYEAMLNNQTVAALTPADVTAVLKGAGKSTSTEAQRPLYRIVNNMRWYCTMNADKNDTQKMVLGEKYSIVFDGYFDRPYTGTLIAANQSDAGLIYTMEINEDIGPFLGVRKAKATIKRTFEGLRIPSRVITIREGKQGVYVQANGAKQFVEIEVLVKNREYAIVRAKEGASLAQGQRVSAS